VTEWNDDQNDFVGKRESPEEKVQLETVNHRLRTSILFGLFAGAVAAVALYLTLR
jgi:hypothetical protein